MIMGENYRISTDKKIATACAVAIGEFRISGYAFVMVIFCRQLPGVCRRSADPMQCKTPVGRVWLTAGS